MIVVDTNVIFPAVMTSEHSCDVSRLQKLDPDWNAPGLWMSELRSTVLSGENNFLGL